MIKADSVWQQLMDVNYDWWKANEHRSYNDMLVHAGLRGEAAILLGNFHYQVCNGGIDQWVMNGYCLSIKRLCDVLTTVGSPIADELSAKLSRLMPFLNLGAKNQGCFGDYWINKYDEDHPAYDMCEELTDWYYSVMDEFGEIVEAWLSSPNKWI